MIATEVLKRGEPRFNMAGQSLPDSLHDTGEKVSDGLATRLHRYAHRELSSVGFALDGWEARVYTMDGDLAPSERYYCVEFVHPKGGVVGVQGIAIGKGGHPILDHGLCIDVQHRSPTPATRSES